MTRKSSRKTIKNRKLRKNRRSRKPVKRSRKPVKNKIKPVKNKIKPVKNKIKPVKRSRKPVKRSRKPVKRSRKPRRKASKKKSRNVSHKFRVKGGKSKRLFVKQQELLRKRKKSKRLFDKRQEWLRNRKRKRQGQMKGHHLRAASILRDKERNRKNTLWPWQQASEWLLGKGVTKLQISRKADELMREQIRQEERGEQARKDRIMRAYEDAMPSDDDSDYEVGDSDSDSDSDSDEMGEDLVAEVASDPASARNPIPVGGRYYATEARERMDSRRFEVNNEFLQQVGFFFARPLGAGVSGSAGLYDFIPGNIKIPEARKLYVDNISQYPPLNPATKSALATVKILDSREKTDKEIAINNHLRKFCKNSYKNYFGGTIPCPFLISSELPFRNPSYKFQWSEGMDMNLRSYYEGYLCEQEQYPFHIVTRIMLQLVSGMINLHKAGVAHSDFKPDQCLLKFSILGDPSSVSKVLIADFGHSGLLDKRGRWKKNMHPSSGAYGYRPLSNFSAVRDKPRGMIVNYFHNDVFALGVTFTRLLCSYEIEDLSYQFNRRNPLINIARYMGWKGRGVPRMDEMLEMGRNSLNRRVARCLNEVFDKQVVNSFTPENPLQAAYQEVLHILLGPDMEQPLQKVLKILTSFVDGRKR